MSASHQGRSRIPPLLEPYIRLPPETSLILLTGTLDATPYWLVTRYLSALLTSGAGSRARDGEAGEADGLQTEGCNVVLVSWMRDWEFWKMEARRGAGLDLARLAQQGRFAFVDGLTDLFGRSALNSKPESDRTAFPATTTPTRGLQSTTLPTRGPAPTSQPPGRGPPLSTRAPVSPAPQSATTLPATNPPFSTHQPPPSPQNKHTLTTPSLDEAQRTILAAITTLTPTLPTFLILDSPTTLLCSTRTSSFQLSSLTLSLREKAHSTLLVAEADSPFLRPATAALSSVHDGPDKNGMEGVGHSTPLEASHAAFVVQQAHSARWVIGTRGLETGVARDVGGVVSVCRGGGWDFEPDSETETEIDGKGLEALYCVGQDGGVRVFERGGGDVG